MRLLLTRAAEDAARTRLKLEAAGHRVIVSPVVEAVATGQRWPSGVVDAVLATSGQAFTVMEGWAEPSPEARRLMPLYLVGGRTATLAAERGFVGPATIAANAATLAIKLGKLTDASKRTLYLAGRDRKPDLETALDVAGSPPEIVEIYEARAASSLTREAQNALATDTVAAVLHFSRRSAALFCALAASAGYAIQPLMHLCLSQDVAGPLEGAACRNIKIAEAPNEEALLALLQV